MPPPFPVFHHQHSIPRPRVKATVTDKVKDVGLCATKLMLQSFQRGSFQSLQFDQALLLHITQSIYQTCPLPIRTKRRVVTGAGEHKRNCQRWPDGR